ncbi:MAG TPA: hypothetical protein VMH41_09065 [Mycobacteriales bacterium]|nr:hypothetical protein [Mycobacteriales bacterium]
MPRGADDDGAEAGDRRELQAQDTRGQPAPRGGLDQRQREDADRQSEQDRADDVRVWLRVGVLALRDRSPGQSERGQTDRDVHPEDQAPILLHEQPADDRAEAGAERPDRRPGPDRAGSLSGRNHGKQQRE